MVLFVPGTPRRFLHLHGLGHAGLRGWGLVLGMGGVRVREGGAAGFQESSAEREELGLALVQQTFTQLCRQRVQLTAHLHRAREQRALTRSVKVSGTQKCKFTTTSQRLASVTSIFIICAAPTSRYNSSDIILAPFRNSKQLQKKKKTTFRYH